MAVVSTQRYAIASEVVARSVGDDTVLLDLKSGTYFTLNAVGTVVWRSITAGEGLDAMASAVVAEFEVDSSTARADVVEFLDAVIEAGLVVTA